MKNRKYPLIVIGALLVLSGCTRTTKAEAEKFADPVARAIIAGASDISTAIVIAAMMRVLFSK